MVACPEKKHVKVRNGTGIPTGLQSWIAKKVMTVFGNTETGTASKKKKTNTWERPARKEKKVWGKPWEEKKKLESRTKLNTMSNKRNTIKSKGNSH
jgi:hypothetical protein